MAHWLRHYDEVLSVVERWDTLPGPPALVLGDRRAPSLRMLDRLQVEGRRRLTTGGAASLVRGRTRLQRGCDHCGSRAARAGSVY